MSRFFRALRALIWELFPIDVGMLDDFVRVYRGAQCTSPVTIRVVMDVEIPPGNTIGGIHGIPAPATVRYGIRVRSVTPEDRPIVYKHFHNKSSAADTAYLMEEASHIAFGLGKDLPNVWITVMDLEGNLVCQKESPVEAG